LARPPRLERGTPGLEGPSSVTFKKWPHFQDSYPPIGLLSGADTSHHRAEASPPRAAVCTRRSGSGSGLRPHASTTSDSAGLPPGWPA